MKHVQNFKIIKSKLARTALIVGFSTAMSFGSVQTASANDAVGDFIHTIMCIGLLITDEERHLTECGTNDFVFPVTTVFPFVAPQPTPDCDIYQFVNDDGNCETIPN